MLSVTYADKPFMLSALMQSVVVLNVVMLSVVVPTSGLYYKSFTIVIYDRNDSGQCNKLFTVVSYEFL